MTKRTETKSLPVTKEMVRQAYKKVRKNKGGPGVDGVTFEHFESSLEKNLYRIWNRLASGSYFPPSVRRVSIPKKDGKLRKLGIPTIGDRVAQQVIKAYIEPRLEKEFSEHSYGYRPLKSAHQAIEAVRKNVRKYAWVLDMDIKSFFDEVDHELILKSLEGHVPESWVKMYVKRWLEAPIDLESGEQVVKEGRGTPQGGVISPLLANLYLHYALDKWLERKYKQVCFVRYADDVIIHCTRESEVRDLLNKIQMRLAECGLRLNETKTRLVYCQDYKREKKDFEKKFDFLGFSFQPVSLKSRRGGRFLGYNCVMSISSKKRVNQEIKQTRFHRWTEATIEDIAKRLNPKLRGWVNYYGKLSRKELQRVFRIFHERLVKWVRNKFKGKTKGQAYAYLRALKRKRPELFYHWSMRYSL